jgi:DNA-binding IclR family transcriptional regulator
LISAVNRAMAILEALSDDARGATVTQLVGRLGIEKSVVSRVLATLEQDGYVLRDPASDVFRVSIRFAAMALRHVERVGLHDLCLPFLQELADSSGELVQLALVTRDGPVYVAKAVGTRRIQALPLIGTEAALHASTAGKLWLATLTEEDALARVLKAGLTKRTPYTITSIDALRTEIKAVRAQGYALLEQELSDDMNAVGVPIAHSRTGQMIAALMIGAPAYRFQRAQMVAAVAELKAKAARLAEVLAIAAPDVVRAQPDSVGHASA